MKIEDMKALCNEYTVDGYRRDIFYKTALNKFEALVNLADQVNAMLSMAKHKTGKAVDDGDSWEISDDVFQEVNKAFEDLNKENPPAP
jgi:hypothetical protein